MSKLHRFDVAVVGLGYIGLPTAVSLSTSGLSVLGVDVDKIRIQNIEGGSFCSTEPGLDSALKRAQDEFGFKVSTSPAEANNYIITVPTPLLPDRTADLSYVYGAVDSIVGFLRTGDLIVIESTCPPGTTSLIADRIESVRDTLTVHRDDQDIEDGSVFLAYCPERIMPGDAMKELVTNDRIVGGISREATQRASELYKSFCHGRLHATDALTAETAKLTENAFRDVNIAFANELSLIAYDLGVDIWELIELTNYHPRVNVLQPGPGVGGHCIAVDPWFLAEASESSSLIPTARAVNENKPGWVAEQILKLVDEANASTVAIFGLTFKPDIDDVRQSPSVEICERLLAENSTITLIAVDPNLNALPKPLRTDRVVLTGVDQAMLNAEVACFLVDHREFREIHTAELNTTQVLDLRRPRSDR